MTTIFRKFFLPCITFLFINLNVWAQTGSNFCPELHPYPSHLFSYNMNYVPKITLETKNNQKVRGYVLLTTKKTADNPYYSSIQLIDLEHPSVPVWFAALKENEGNHIAD